MFFSLILWSNLPSQTQLAPLNGWWGNEPLFVFLCGISGDDQWLKDVFNSAWIITTVCLVKSIGTVVDAVAGRYALTIDCAQRLTWAGCKTKTKTKTNTRCLWIKGRENFFFFPCCGLCLCLQRTVWQVEQAVVELKARPRERHLRGHDHGGWRRRQEESLAVGLQTPGAAQSEGRRQWNQELKTEKNNRITNHKIKICLFVNATNIYIYVFLCF